MKERIKDVRKYYKLTQTQFGERIGMKGNSITSYETGVRIPTRAVICSICREFGVRRAWLENGEGEMFAPSNPQTLDRIAKRYSESQTFRAMLDVYAQMDEEGQEAVERYIEMLSEAVAKGKDPAAAIPTQEDVERNAAAMPYNDMNPGNAETVKEA